MPTIVEKAERSAAHRTRMEMMSHVGGKEKTLRTVSLINVFGVESEFRR